jgi:hypothetical protein
MTDRPRSEEPGLDPEDPQQPQTGRKEEGRDQTVRPGPETPGDLWGERQHDADERSEDDKNST